MTNRPILVAQISDLHIKRPGELAYCKVDTAAALSRCVAQLNRLVPLPDLVVISGDLADTPTQQEYNHLKHLLAPLQIPFVAIPGNHDERISFRAALSGQPYAQLSGALNIEVPLRELDIVLMDSSVPGASHGELDSNTLTWLDTTLSASASRPALLFLHHPPFITGIGHMDVQNLRNHNDLAAVVGRHRRVRFIAAGHVHRATATMFAGVPATICPAPNHAVALDLVGQHPPSFNIEPPSFHLHAWFLNDENDAVVTHLVSIGDFDGPYPFFGPDGRLL